MPKLTIDGTEIEVPANTTVIQACEMLGIEIPRFCYHPRLAIAGNCRMCLVEVSPGPPKPQASCALPVADKMVVKTNTPMVKKAREGVMEFLLINHPLDCPVCDQGGECDLQDQAMAYGSGLSRYVEHKRAVTEKEMGPLIKTQMTRCIHCTRCVRFAADIAGVDELGALGRGEHMEITNYIEGTIRTELAGNLVDVCPVGALTSAPYAFKGRPWEIVKTESIDVLDAVGSNIRVDSRGREVLRVLPRLNEDVNEEWISDKTRHAIDGLKVQRLDKPMLRRGGRLERVSWEEAFAAIAHKFASTDANGIAAIAGDLVDCESVFALKSLMDSLGSPHMDCRQDGAKLEAYAPGSYRFNTTIAGIEEADACLIIGANPRLEAPLINARLRKRFLRGGFRVGNIGGQLDLTYPTEQLGNAPSILAALAIGKHQAAEFLKSSQKPMLILGMDALSRPDGAQILMLARKIAESTGMVKEGWNGFNVLHKAAGRVGALDLGFVPGEKGRDVAGILEGAASGEIHAVYLLGADEIDTGKLGAAFVIYQGHHGDRGAHRADVILPGAAYTEKDGTYLNTEGRVQRALKAVFPPGEAQEDWRILRALSEVLGRTLPFNSLEALRAQMEAYRPHLAHVDQVTTAAWGAFGKEGGVMDAPFTSSLHNFYMTDPISRASKTMAECSRVMMEVKKEAA